MLKEPLEHRLVNTDVLKRERSKENTADALEIMPPTVIPTEREPNLEEYELQRNDESDCHSVASQPLALSLTEPVYTFRPSPAPCTVRLRDPDTARLGAFESLMLIACADIA
jgi:hypothetical protein